MDKKIAVNLNVGGGMESSNLSLVDVKRLIRWPMPSTRAEMAEKVAESYGQGMFEGKEKALAEEIFLLLALDVESMVRKALSESLKNNQNIPHQLALKLATDLDEEVAVPMLEYSKVLNETDLKEIIRSTHIASRLCAIAKRDKLSPELCTNLIEKKFSKVAIILAQNDNVNLNEDNLKKMLQHFRMRGDVIETLVNRGNLPMSIVEEMLTVASEEIYKKLIKEYNVAPIKGKHEINSIREKVLLNITKDANGYSTEELIDHLQKQNKLTHSVVLRSLCKGDLKFFEASLAKLSSINTNHAVRLLKDVSGQGFSTIYKASGMPGNMMQAIKIIYNIIIEEYAQNNIITEKDFAKIISKKIKDEGYDKTIAIMPYMLILINNESHSDNNIL